MNESIRIGKLGEIELIKLIEDLVLKKTGKDLLREDAFFFDLKHTKWNKYLIINSDMLVSTTDVPPQMHYYQIGRKSVIMNISDLLVKGVQPRVIIISLGLPGQLERTNFISLIEGIIDFSIKFNLDYIGGDINETKEIIISPTVIGFKKPSNIIYRRGLKEGDVLIANNKFGLTGVGFDILLNKKAELDTFSSYNRSIKSVLEPDISGKEALILSKYSLATSSIDSSDGLTKSLIDLMISNPGYGFKIDFDDNLIDPETVRYSQENNVPLESLVFNGGEEFIHLFTINPGKLNSALKIISAKGGNIFKIGEVISEEKIYLMKDDTNYELKNYGYQHFL